jgi:cytochrome c551/c552
LRALQRAAGLIVAAAALGLASGRAVAPVAAQEADPPRTLTPGPGADLTMLRCSICHEITHVTRARLSRGEWEFNVKNMIERGMPIAAAEIPVVVNYLATYYNREQPAPKPDPALQASSSTADPISQLLSANGCSACHGVEQKIVGPAFTEVAARYVADPKAASALSAKIREGGSGVWGPVPMPPNPGLSDADLARLVSWILGQK